MDSLGFTLVQTLVRQLKKKLLLIDGDSSHLRLSFDSGNEFGTSGNIRLS